MPGSSPQDDLEHFKFAGYEVPCLESEMEGGIRDHVHEYSHEDGGDPEKLGRSLYLFNATVDFKAKLARYPNLWPKVLNELTTIWESGTTEALVVPSYGTIQAYAFKWTRKWSARIRSGERVTVRFREDATNLPVKIFSAPSPAALATGASSLAATLDRANGLTTSDMNLFDQLQTLVNSLVAVKDTASLVGNLVAARVAQVTSMCEQIDHLPSMQSPSNWPVVNALHGLWVAAAQMAGDTQNKRLVLQEWTVPRQMSITAVSTNIYGDASHVEDLLSLNSGDFTDPLAIPAGTEIAYYPPTTGVTAAGIARVVLGVK